LDRLDHAEARADIEMAPSRNTLPLGRDTDTDETKIVTECLHGFKGGPTLPKILRFPEFCARREDAPARKMLRGREPAWVSSS